MTWFEKYYDNKAMLIFNKIKIPFLKDILRIAAEICSIKDINQRVSEETLTSNVIC